MAHCYILINLIDDISVIFWSVCNLGLVDHYLTTEAVSSRNVVIVLSTCDAGNVPINYKPYCCTVHFVESLQLSTKNCTYINST